MTWRVFLTDSSQPDLERLTPADRAALTDELFAWVSDGPPRTSGQVVAGAQLFEDQLPSGISVTYFRRREGALRRRRSCPATLIPAAGIPQRRRLADSRGRTYRRLRNNLGVTLECVGARRGPGRVLGVVSDLDGTLLRSDGSLSPATMSVLDTLAGLGIPLVVATARTPRALQKVSGHEHLGRVVCANGVIVWDAKRDEVVKESCFAPSALAVAVHRLKEALPGAGVALLSARTMFIDDTYLGLRNKKAEGAEVFSDIDLVLSRHRIVMVAVRHPRLVADDILAPTVEAFAGVGVASFAGLTVVDIVPMTATKAIAAAEEMTSKGCGAEATVVFGDMPNDLPLFRWAGWACAVANSHPDVLEAADEVVPSNDDDGVARTVQRLIGL